MEPFECPVDIPDRYSGETAPGETQPGLVGQHDGLHAVRAARSFGQHMAHAAVCALVASEMNSAARRDPVQFARGSRPMSPQHLASAVAFRGELPPCPQRSPSAGRDAYAGRPSARPRSHAPAPEQRLAHAAGHVRRRPLDELPSPAPTSPLASVRSSPIAGRSDSSRSRSPSCCSSRRDSRGRARSRSESRSVRVAAVGRARARHARPIRAARARRRRCRRRCALIRRRRRPAAAAGASPAPAT